MQKIRGNKSAHLTVLWELNELIFESIYYSAWHIVSTIKVLARVSYFTLNKTL
jgi:hypothetical protein